jgi:hypothetical protein
MGYRLYQVYSSPDYEPEYLDVEFDSVESAYKWHVDNNIGVNMTYFPDEFEKKEFDTGIKFKSWTEHGKNCFYNFNKLKDEYGEYIPFCTFYCQGDIRVDRWLDIK